MDEKRRREIEEEERYRAEVRGKLENKPQVKSKKKGIGCLGWGVIVVFGFFIYGLVAGSGSDYSSLSSGSLPAASSAPPRDVAYKVDSWCPDGLNVTYVNQNGDITQENGVDADTWSYSFSPQRMMFISISAQTQCEHDDVTVRLVRGSEVLRENTSSGGYVIASLDGMWTGSGLQ